MNSQAKRKSARFLGMTTMQIGILAGTAAVALLLLCGVSWFVFASLPTAQPSMVTSEIPPIVTQSATATITAIPLTPTLPSATSAPPDGWAAFSAAGATVWLPANFIGGDMVEGRDATIEQITNLGSYLKPAREAMKLAPSQVVLWMVDKTLKTQANSDIIATLIVSHEAGMEGMTLEEYAKNDPKGMPQALSTTIYETNKITLLGRETRRVTYQQQVTPKDEAMGIVYYIKDGSDFWKLDYIVDLKEYSNLLTMIEKSARTFSLVK